MPVPVIVRLPLLNRWAMKFLLVGFIIGGAALAAGQHPAVAQGTPTVQTRNVGALGTVLTGANGMTLYTFDRDMPGVSNCNDQCAVTWPPLLLESGNPVAPAGLGGTLSVITRSDGRRQVAYNNDPIYFYVQDTQPGDTKGEGVGGVSFVIKTSAAASSGTGAAAMPRTGTGLFGDQTATRVTLLAGLGLIALVLGGVALRTHPGRR